LLFQTTEIVGTPFVGVTVSNVAFSDVDGDGDNDVLIVGAPGLGPEIVTLYTNDGSGNFTEVEDSPFDNIKVRSFAFSDVDGDGDSDLLMIGRENLGAPFTLFVKLFINDGVGRFSEVVDTPFEGGESSALAFADVDGDGDSDVMITASTGAGTQITKLYTNDGLGNFTEVSDTPFIGVASGSIAFADVDGDGDNDVLVTGRSGPVAQSTYIAKLYTYDVTINNYTEVANTPFVGVAGGFKTIAFSDVDGDGDPDVLITGQDSSFSAVAKLYTNDGLITSWGDVHNTLDFGFTAYPNPATASEVNISYQSNENSLMKVRVFDLNGRLLIRQHRHSTIGQQIFTIDIASLVQGAYFVELDNGIKRGFTKIMVQ